jgi:hypothetical protein
LDDLNNIVKNIPEDAEIIWLGYPLVVNQSEIDSMAYSDKRYTKEIVNNYVVRLKDTIGPGAFGLQA